MVWTCAKCGTEAATESVGMLVAMGWRITEPKGGVCPACVRKEVNDDVNLTGERARKRQQQRRDRTP